MRESRGEMVSDQWGIFIVAVGREKVRALELFSTGSTSSPRLPRSLRVNARQTLSLFFFFNFFSTQLSETQQHVCCVVFVHESPK